MEGGNVKTFSETKNRGVMLSSAQHYSSSYISSPVTYVTIIHHADAQSKYDLSNGVVRTLTSVSFVTRCAQSDSFDFVFRSTLDRTAWCSQYYIRLQSRVSIRRVVFLPSQQVRSQMLSCGGSCRSFHSNVASEV